MYPKELNYRMPAEFAEHERTFLSWPVQESMCHPDEYVTVCKSYYVELVKAIAEFEPVTVIVNPEELEAVKTQMQDVQKVVAHPIDYLPIPHNDAWLRDNGPTFIIDDRGNVAGINWRFNAWGGKYSPWDLDDALAKELLDHYQIRRFDAPIVLEGGSIHTDGEGTLLTTEECLLNANRNSQIKKEQLAELLKQYLDVKKIIWLKNGLDGDETDGHIDNLACFAAPGKVILQVCDDPNDPNFEVTQEALKALEDTQDAQARKLEIIKIKQPPRRMHGSERLTLSYLNFYFVNGGIILPIFGGDAEDTDIEAIETLQQVFPERVIRTVFGMAISKEGGNVHCTTQQMPKAITNA